MPCGQDEQRIVIGRFLNIGNAGAGSGDAKDLLKMREFWLVGIGERAAQASEFGFGMRKAAGDDPGFFQQELVEFRKEHASASIFGTRGNGGRDEPAFFDERFGRRNR